jgi:hypothetical protein
LGTARRVHRRWRTRLAAQCTAAPRPQRAEARCDRPDASMPKAVMRLRPGRGRRRQPAGDRLRRRLAIVEDQHCPPVDLPHRRSALRWEAAGLLGEAAVRKHLLVPAVSARQSKDGAVAVARAPVPICKRFPGTCLVAPGWSSDRRRQAGPPHPGGRRWLNPATALEEGKRHRRAGVSTALRPILGASRGFVQAHLVGPEAQPELPAGVSREVGPGQELDALATDGGGDEQLGSEELDHFGGDL